MQGRTVQIERARKGNVVVQLGDGEQVRWARGRQELETDVRGVRINSSKARQLLHNQVSLV